MKQDIAKIVQAGQKAMTVFLLECSLRKALAEAEEAEAKAGEAKARTKRERLMAENWEIIVAETRGCQQKTSGGFEKIASLAPMSEPKRQAGGDPPPATHEKEEPMRRKLLITAIIVLVVILSIGVKLKNPTFYTNSNGACLRWEFGIVTLQYASTPIPCDGIPKNAEWR